MQKLSPQRLRSLKSKAKRISRSVIRLERQYYRMIQRVFAEWFGELLEAIRNTGFVKLDGPIDFLANLFDSFRQRWGERVNTMANQISILGQNINELTAGYFSEDLNAASFSIGLQSELTETMQAFTRQNVALIKNIGEQTATGMERLVMDAFTKGTATKTLAKDIQNLSTEFGKNRAKLIARDQLSKLSGQLTETRAKSAGSDEYIWETVGDSRVRPKHQELDGKVRKWSQSPTPGQEIQCRCFPTVLF